MRKYLIVSILIVLVAASGCKKDNKTITSNYIKGSISLNAPNYLIVSQPVDISLALAITEPESDIQYEFSLPSFSTETIINTNGIITGLTAPSTPGTYTITATATHPDYSSISAPAVTVIVFNPTLSDSYNGYINGENSMIDTRDNKEYHYTHIGSLDWMTSNLQWAGAGQSPDSTAALDLIYGRLYTWEEATGGVSGSGVGGGATGVCPIGWSIPTNDDWADFASALASAIAGTPSSLTFEDVWEGLGNHASAEITINGDRQWSVYSPDNKHENTFKWNGAPAGLSYIINSDPGNETDAYSFLNRSNTGLWWSGTESNTDMAYYRHIDDQSSNFPYERGNKKYLGLSVRCVRIH